MTGSEPAPPRPETIAEVSCLPCSCLSCKFASLHHGVLQELLARTAPLQAQRIRRPARIGAALENAGLLVGHDRADGARKPCPIRPPSDRMAKAGERLAGRLVDPALHVEQARMI